MSLQEKKNWKKFTQDQVSARQKANSGQSLSPIQVGLLAAATSKPTEYKTVAQVKQDPWDDMGWGMKILDTISRPFYATTDAVSAVVDNVQGEEDAANPFSAAVTGFTGQGDRKGFADVLTNASLGKQTPEIKQWADESGLTAITRQGFAAPGLALDLAADPLNLIGSGIFRAAGKGIAKVAGKAPRAVVEESRLLNDAADIATEPVKVGPNAASSSAFDDAVNTPVEAPAAPRDPILEAEVAGFTPQQYNSALDIALKVGGSINPSTLSRMAKVKYGEANRILKQMEADGIVGPVIRKSSDKAHNVGERARGSLARPILATERPEIYYGKDIVESTAKVQGAAKVANEVAPETVAALPVQNIARKEVPNLAPQGQGMIGSDLINKARPNLIDPVTRKELYRPGRDRAQALRTEVLPQWLARVDEEAAKGGKPVLFAADDTPYTLSIPHVLAALPERVTDDLVFGASFNKYNANANLYHTQIGRGIAEALRVDDLKVPLIADRYKQVLKAIMDATPKKYGSRKPPKGAMAAAARALVDNTQTIRDVQYSLAKTLGKKDVEDAAEIYHRFATGLLDDLDNTTLPSSVVMANLANVGGDTATVAKELGASDNAASIASSEIADLTAKVAPEADVAASRAAAAVSRDRKVAEETGKDVDAQVNRRVQRGLATAAKEADQIDPKALDTIDLSVRADLHMNSMIQKMLQPVRNMFQRGYGHEEFADAYRAGHETAATKAHDNATVLNRMAKTIPREIQSSVFSAIKRREIPGDVNQAQAFQEMSRAVDRVFDTNDPYFGALWRTGAGVEEINKAFRLKQVGNKGDSDFFQFKQTKKGEKKGISVADQWREWDIKDPLDFLSRSYDAVIHLAAKQAFATDFAMNFGKETPMPGYVKIKAGEDSALGAFVDKDKFYPREISETLTRLDAAIRQPTSYRGEKGTLAGFVNGVVDPVLQIWKPYMTIVRPGHAIRNMIGTMFAALLDGVKNPGSYVKGFKMMQAGGGLKKTGMEGLNQLDSAPVNGAHVMSTVRLRGRNSPTSYDRMYQLARDNGLFISYMASDDLLEATNKVNKLLLENPWMKTMGKFNETTSNGMRAAHFTDLMQRTSFTRQFATIEEAASAAAARVKKFQPDPNGLTPFEKKNMRRIIPFYTWFRQALPMVATTMLSHPGRLTVPLKAQYNAAIAMGNNPDSMTEPFDPDKLYPSFIRNHLTGPIIGDLTSNLGSPTEAIFGDVIGNSPDNSGVQTARNIGSMLNPIPKALVEIGTQTNIVTGRSVWDTTEYADGLVPVVNQVAGIGGVSTFGTLQSLMQGAPKIDPQRAVARGEKAHFFNMNLLNFLSGLGIQDTTKESYTKIARQEEG